MQELAIRLYDLLSDIEIEKGRDLISVIYQRGSKGGCYELTFSDYTTITINKKGIVTA